MTIRLSSRVPAALANLHQLYTAAVAVEHGEAVAVAYGVPGNLLDETICITGDVVDIEQAYANQGAKSRDEAFQLEVIIWELRAGRTQQEAIDRAFELLATLELKVHRENITLALAAGEIGPCVYSRITPKQCNALVVADQGYGVELRCIVDCVARI